MRFEPIDGQGRCRYGLLKRGFFLRQATIRQLPRTYPGELRILTQQEIPAMSIPRTTPRAGDRIAIAVGAACLAACGGYGSGGNYAMNKPTQTTISGAILPTLATLSTIGSTLDPTEKGGNPYGLTVATATSGPITMGDLVICNFNDGATNTQGLGTTVVGLHPKAGATPYRIAQSNQLLGCSAVTSLADGSIVAAAGQANAVVLISPSGALSTPFAADTFAEPWSVIEATRAGTEVVYVSNAQTGTIDRITIAAGAQTAFTEIASGFSTNQGVPGSISAPAGLTYDASSDTLYVVDTNANRVVGLDNVSAIGTDGVVVAGTSFTGPSASSAKVIVAGSPLNGPISAALLVNGDLVVGNTLDPTGTNLLVEISPASGVVATMNVDKGAAGALFGIVAVPKTITTMGAYGTTSTLTDIIYFNDDNDNTVKLLSQ